jgi:phospholipid/cholesterol/gamma-HCH transport system ATP-binding protein
MSESENPKSPSPHPLPKKGEEKKGKNESPPVIEIKNLTNQLGDHRVQNGLNLSVLPHEILGIIGGSGSGKTTLLRSILMLLKPTAGSIHVFGKDVTRCSAKEANAIRRRFGVLFQKNALFSSLNVLENVQFPLRTFTRLPISVQENIALLKIAFSGLPQTAATKYPSELSGGMEKRAALARAISLDPELLFLDEPTAGLDPKSAAEFDALILNLCRGLGLTVVIITHDMDSLSRIADRVAFLGDGKVLAVAPLAELMKNEHPMIQDYFSAHKKKES